MHHQHSVAARHTWTQMYTSTLRLTGAPFHTSLLKLPLSPPPQTFTPHLCREGACGEGGRRRAAEGRTERGDEHGGVAWRGRTAHCRAPPPQPLVKNHHCVVKKETETETGAGARACAVKGMWVVWWGLVGQDAAGTGPGLSAACRHRPHPRPHPPGLAPRVHAPAPP
jgi:hypothetical protein